MDPLLLGNKIDFWWGERKKVCILSKPTTETAGLQNLRSAALDVGEAENKFCVSH